MDELVLTKPTCDLRTSAKTFGVMSISWFVTLFVNGCDKVMGHQGICTKVGGSAGPRGEVPYNSAWRRFLSRLGLFRWNRGLGRFLFGGMSYNRMERL
jgi:hypothetical protein